MTGLFIMGSPQGGLELLGQGPQVAGPVFGQGVGNHNPTADFRGNKLSAFGRKLGLNEYELYAALFGMLDERLELRRLRGFALDFDG
jgi:hypothetical protein